MKEMANDKSSGLDGFSTNSFGQTFKILVSTKRYGLAN